MRGLRRAPNRSAGTTRAERRADARRSRALSHLERVRGGVAPRKLDVRVQVAAAFAALAFGALVGATFEDAIRARRGDGRIASIAVVGTDRVAAADVAAASGVARGAEAAAVDPVAVAAKVASHDWIESARSLALPTGTVLVSVVERRPAVRVTGPGDGPIQLADATGTPFAPAEPQAWESLPLVRLPHAVVPQTADADIAGAQRLASALAQAGLPSPLEIAVADPADPRGYTLQLAGLASRVILGWDDPQAVLPALARLLDAPVSELDAASELDLRFADQAILRTDPLPEGAEPAAKARGGAPPST